MPAKYTWLQLCECHLNVYGHTLLC